jgi:hypothetical protein
MNSKHVGLIICVAVATLFATPSRAVAAPPKLQHLFPPGGKRGESVEVTASGTFDKWPVQIWVDHAGVDVVAEKDKGKFKVTIAADAEPGVYWLRAFHPDGASSLRPFVVGMLDEVIEAEPNEKLDQGHPISGATIVNGRLGKSGDVDTFQLDLKGGQTLVAALDASRTLGSPMDAVMQVCDDRGFVIEQNDDARGTDPMIVLQIPRDGRYFVRLFAFPAAPNSTIRFAGSKDYLYRLTLTTDGFVNHALPLAVPRSGPHDVTLFGWNLADDLKPLSIAPPLETSRTSLFSPSVANAIMVPVVEHRTIVATPGSGPKQPQAIQLPAVISGQVEEDRDVDSFRFAATKGDKLLFRAESDSLGYLLDPVLTLVDATGKVVAEVDDTSRQRDCELAATIPADGDYDLQIRDLHRHGGFRYVYRITATKSEPDFKLTLANETFVLTPGKPLAIEIAVNRLRGFKEAIQVTAIELPSGVTVKPVTSEPKGDSSKKVKLELVAKDGPVEGTFRISGMVPSEGGQKRFARFSPAGSKDTLDQPWLTVIAPTK